MKRLWLLMALMLCAGSASAQFAVIDPANLAQNILQVGHNVTLIAKEVEQYTQMIKDYQQLIKEYESMTGLRGFASAARNGMFDKDVLRRAVPRDNIRWMQSRYILDYLDQTGQNRQFSRDMRRVMETYLLPEREALFGRSTRFNTPTSVAYGELLKSSQAAMAGASATQTMVDSRLAAVEDLIDETGSEENEDLKAAIDLNTRMQAETAILVAALLEAHSRDTYARMSETQGRLAGQSATERLFRVYR